MLLFCVLYERRDSNNRLTYCKLRQFLFTCCTLLFLYDRNLFVFLRIVFNTVYLCAIAIRSYDLKFQINTYLALALSNNNKSVSYTHLTLPTIYSV